MTFNKVLVIYHKNCLDGFGSAFAAWLHFGDSAEYLPMSYDDAPPNVEGKDVYIVDFSFKRPILDEMLKKAKFVKVIDHHKTAYEDLKDFPLALFDMERSGAVLTYQYFHSTEVPKLLLHIQDRDLWQFKLDGTKEITTALYETVPFEFEVWQKLDCDELLKIGTVLRTIHEKEVSNLAKRAHLISFNEVVGLAVNTNAKYSSELGNLLAQESETFGATYSFNGKRELWEFQLRSIGDFDVSVIAKQYGGGGHKNAAGFSVVDASGFVVENIPEWAEYRVIDRNGNQRWYDESFGHYREVNNANL